MVETVANHKRKIVHMEREFEAAKKKFQVRRATEARRPEPASRPSLPGDPVLVVGRLVPHLQSLETLDKLEEKKTRLKAQYPWALIHEQEMVRCQRNGCSLGVAGGVRCHRDRRQVVSSSIAPCLPPSTSPVLSLPATCAALRGSARTSRPLEGQGGQDPCKDGQPHGLLPWERRMACPDLGLL